MGNCCGQCRHYRLSRHLECICTKTGKNVGYLWNKECFEPIPLPQPVAGAALQKDNISKQITAMEEKTQTKVCKVCGKELPVDQFRPNPKCKDGHLDTCYECLNKKTKETNRRKEDELIEKIFGKPEEKVSEKVEKAATRATETISKATDQELVDELRARGWDVKCTRLVEL